MLYKLMTNDIFKKSKTEIKVKYLNYLSLPLDFYELPDQMNQLENNEKANKNEEAENE